MKILNRILLLALCMGAALTAMAQSISNDAYVKNGQEAVTVTALTDNVIKVTYARPGQEVRPSAMSMLDDSMANADVSSVGKYGKSLETAASVLAILNEKSGQVTIESGVDKWVRTAGVTLLPDGRQSIRLNVPVNDSYYGAGERGHSLNLRGDTLVMYNRQNYGYTKGDPRINQMNITMPLIISSNGFALLFDDFGAAELILNNDIQYVTESAAALSFYYINGAASIADVTEQLTSLTGRQPIPPLWALGYITSKYGYYNEKETVGAIDSLKRDGYPVDGIVLDLYWYGKEQDMGRLAWEPKQWPNPKKMLKRLQDQNVNLIAISQPYVLRNGKGVDNYNYLAPRGMLMADSTGLAPQEVEIWVGEGGMLDVSNPETQKWLANTYKQLTDMGVAGWWGDLGEPEVHPQTGLHNNGLTARQYHNQYGNDWSKIVYDMFAENYPDRRVISMMRGGTTGLQKYGVFPWSTDVSRSWEGLQPQVTIMLNSGLSGLGYMGHDVGGFAVDKENPEDPELYVRWLQLGLFSPMMRTHAQYKAEPYHYPQYQDILLNLVKRRYAWLPYNYTLAYENAKYGYPLVRPLNFYEPGVNAYDDIDDEFLWGSEVLVAPVMTKGATERKVVFPQGQWVDMANPKVVYNGGSEIIYPAPLHVLPLFAKAGAFIPQSDYKMTSTADYKPGEFTMQYYPVDGVSSKYTMYDDNRVSASALETGQYRLLNFEGIDKDNTVTVTISWEGIYENAPQKLEVFLVFNGIGADVNEIGINRGKLVMSNQGDFLAAKITINTNETEPVIITVNK